VLLLLLCALESWVRGGRSSSFRGTSGGSHTLDSLDGALSSLWTPISMNLWTLALFVVIMSLSNLSRIACTVFHGSCACKPSLTSMKMAMYCSPTSMPVTRVPRVARAANRATHSLSTTRMYASEPDRSQAPAESVSFKDKVSGMWKNYGKVAIGTYLSIYVMTLSSLFVSLDFDLFNAATFGFDPVGAIGKVSQMSDRGAEAISSLYFRHTAILPYYRYIYESSSLYPTISMTLCAMLYVICYMYYLPC
jgi:hypothetical protein